MGNWLKNAFTKVVDFFSFSDNEPKPTYQPELGFAPELRSPSQPERSLKAEPEPYYPTNAKELQTALNIAVLEAEDLKNFQPGRMGRSGSGHVFEITARDEGEQLYSALDKALGKNGFIDMPHDLRIQMDDGTEVAFRKGARHITGDEWQMIQEVKAALLNTEALKTMTPGEKQKVDAVIGSLKQNFNQTEGNDALNDANKQALDDGKLDSLAEKASRKGWHL